jgi:hypothetical protein
MTEPKQLVTTVDLLGPGPRVPLIDANEDPEVLEWLARPPARRFFELLVQDWQARAMRVCSQLSGNPWKDGQVKGQLEGRGLLYRDLRQSLQRKAIQDEEKAHAEDER